MLLSVVRHLRAIAMGAVVITAASSGVQADDSADVARTIFGVAPGAQKTFACYKRVYDPAHLQAHPRQTVTAMTLLVGSQVDAETQTPTFTFDLAVKRRGARVAMESSGGCRASSDASAGASLRATPVSTAAGPGLKLVCSVDCDGGGLTMTPTGSGLRVDIEAIRLTPKGGDIEDASELAGGDDKAFLLEKTRIDDCLPLMSEDDRSSMKR